MRVQQTGLIVSSVPRRRETLDNGRTREGVGDVVYAVVVAPVLVVAGVGLRDLALGRALLRAVGLQRD